MRHVKRSQKLLLRNASSDTREGSGRACQSRTKFMPRGCSYADPTASAYAILGKSCRSIGSHGLAETKGVAILAFHPFLISTQKGSDMRLVNGIYDFLKTCILGAADNNQQRPYTMSIPQNSKIAVICAYNRGNSGMYSVDLAAHDFFSRHNVNFSMFCSQARNLAETSNYGKMTIKTFRSISELEGFTHIVYWGDFQNSPYYGQRDFSIRERSFGLSIDDQSAFQKWLELFALSEGRPESVRRVVSVGNNFQNGFELSPDLRLRTLNGFNTNFDVVLPRDPQSLYSLHRQFDSSFYDKAELGMDAAFLLPSQEYVEPKPHHKKTLGFFFGRSGIKNRRDIVRAVARQLGLEAVRIGPWLPGDVMTVRNKFPRMLTRMRDSAFILTDTYHCCVNGMNLGTPVIGLGVAATSQVGSLGDYKKAELFAMLGLSDMYVPLKADTADKTEITKIAEIAQYVNASRNFTERRYAPLRAAKARFEARLLKALAYAR